MAVADALSKHGFECVPQVGVAGYFLDIAVKDPGNPGRYLMAVECDGASYHSAKSTRDRDRLRQTILEQRGWLVRRIWSTDWFNNPAAQLAPIVTELNELKSTVGPAEDVDIEEIDEIPDVAEKLADEDDFVEAFAQGEVDLKTALERFEREVIRPEFPDTKPERRLLRPAMLEALLEFTPTSSWEFHQNIPPFLRMSVDAEEGKYLKQVFEIIYESQADVETGLPTQKLDF